MSARVEATAAVGSKSARLPAKRVLISRIGAMGDVLHALPAVAALRALHPDWFIGWAIEPRWSGLLQIAGDFEDMSQGVGHFAPKALVDRWYRVPTQRWRKRPFAGETISDILALREVLREERFDLCVDLQGSLKSAWVGGMAKAGAMVGSEKPRERMARWWYGEKVQLEGVHVVEQACELLGAAVGETLTPAKVQLPMEERDELWAHKATKGRGFALISPGAGWGAKMWPAERYGQVAVELGRTTGLRTLVNASLQGSGEAEDVVRASEGFATAVPCTVGQLIALTRRAEVVIAGDSGPLHLAAALERPVVGIYGPTDPKRNGPWGTRSRVLRDAESVTSHKRVKMVEAGMLRVQVEGVVAAVVEVLG
jgi:heptosyltransferase I